MNYELIPLPVSAIADDVSRSLRERPTLVVTAPPGAGKSTLLPLTILRDAPVDGRILVLEPRRIAARQIAERMADLLGERVGETVGYRIRFETKVSKSTRIEVLTEGILTRMLTTDPTLEGVGLVIFDEFHERSLHSDLAFALTRQVQNVLRPELRLLIMSATIDASALCNALQAPLIESQGKLFPVEILYAKADTMPRDMPQAVASQVRRALQENDGDVLAFLPGQADIEKCAELLAGIDSVSVFPLYGNLPPAEQRKAIMPCGKKPGTSGEEHETAGDGRRRIVLATPIAETSLTIEGISIVIDSGLCRTLVFDERTGLSRLETATISMDMAKQRSGRAGRLSSGVCYRLWTKAAEHRMAEQRKAEIESADLAPMLLSIAAFGETDASALPWLTPPPLHALAAARRLLCSLGAIDAEGSITSLGKQMASLPCHPRIARMILRGASVGQTALACDIAALLEEKDPLSQGIETDIELRIDMLRQARRRNSLGKWQRIAQVAEAYGRMARTLSNRFSNVEAKESFPFSSEGKVVAAGALLAYAYPERIAMQMDKAGRYRLSSGEEVRLDRNDPLSACPWLVVASLYANGSNGHVFLAAAVEPQDLEDLASERDLVAWDTGRDALLMQHEWRVGQLLLRSKPIHDVPRELAERAVCDAVKKYGLSLLDWNDAVSGLQRRVAQAAAWHPELQLPDLSAEHLLATAHDWLPYYIYVDGRLRSTGASLRRIDLCEVLWSLIPFDLQQAVDRLAPSHVMVPTGSRIRLDYRLGSEAPVLSVRLQECFGMQETPRVNDGKVALLMELLSPGYKPVQLTSDLKSFWQTMYFEVRGELRRRYPKHYWPDNPLEAEPTNRTKKSKG